MKVIQRYDTRCDGPELVFGISEGLDVGNQLNLNSKKTELDRRFGQEAANFAAVCQSVLGEVAVPLKE